MPEIKITFGYPIGPNKDDWEEITEKSDNQADAITFVKSCFEDYDKLEAKADQAGEETLCGKPHNNGDDRPEVCNECMIIKEGI